VPVETATFPDLRPDLTHFYLTTAYDAPDEVWNVETFTARVSQFDQVWLSTFTNERSQMQAVGSVTRGPAGPPPAYRASFEDRLYLVEANFDVQGDALVLTLDWVLAQAGLPPDSNVFRNVFDCAGNVLGLGSGLPMEGMLSLAGLPEGARVRDVKHISLTANAADGCYQVEVGLFRGDGSRLEARAPDGSEYPNRLVLVTR
jgi:hypothetical protein